MESGVSTTEGRQKGGIAGECYGSTLNNCYSSFSPYTDNTGSITSAISCGVCTELFAFDGFGIEQRPYVIANAEDLIKLSKLTNIEESAHVYSSSHYVQTSDIDLNNNQFTPICKTFKDGIEGALPNFSGHYNGDYHKIQNLYVNESNKFAGLFGSLNGGVLENLSIVGSINNEEISTGGIVGEIGDEATVQYCSFIGNVTSSKFATGGIVGYIWQSGTVKNCYHNGEVVSGGSAGGIVGRIAITEGDYSALVSDNYSVGKISGYAGSIVGYMELSELYQSANITIENCYSLTEDGNNIVNGGCTKYDVTSLTRYELKKAADKLGEPFITNSVPSYNNGYPIFEWQMEDAENSKPIIIPFSGEGTENNPYQIETAEDLFMLSDVVNDKETGDYFRSCYYVQTKDIDLNNQFFTPIGLNGNFLGSYNGNYHKIINLKINTSKSSVGLFSSIREGGSIQKLSVEGNVSSSGDNVGGIIGTLDADTRILDCDYHGSVTGSENVGSLVGLAENGVTIESCYSNAKVTGKAIVGGLVGSVQSTSEGNKISKMYFSGTVACDDTEQGAMCGTINDENLEISSIYFLSTVCDGNAVNGESVTGCTKLGATALKACADMLGSPFTGNNSDLYDGYPIFEWQSTPYQFKGNGTESNPYKISTKTDLENMRALINSSYYNHLYGNAYFIQTADIDLENELWTPIASSESGQTFHGFYDGACHYIRGMNVNANSTYTGLFGVTESASISDIVVYGSVSSSGEYSGGIVGQAMNNTQINRCAFIGSVSAENAAGGIIGNIINSSQVSDCYHNGTVNSNSYSGGIVGSISFADDVDGESVVVQNCYQANGIVNGTSSSGCIVGTCEIKTGTANTISVLNCFATTDADAVSNQTNATKDNTLVITKSMLKSASEDLGTAFINNTDTTLNDGYPVFTWQIKSDIVGDVNNDGVFDVSDIVVMQKWILNAGQMTNWQNGDLYKDNQINVFDLCLMKQKIIYG